jgi:hypothetical protein
LSDNWVKDNEKLKQASVAAGPRDA